MTTLVAIGCSHMAGCELDIKNKDSYYNRQNCFAARVAKHFGYNYKNLSVAGGSNQFIYRKLIEFITTHTDKNEKYFFLLGWTSHERMELKYSNDNSYTFNTLADYCDNKYFPFTSGTEPKIILESKIRKLSKFADVLFESDLKETETATLVWSAQEILKHHKFNYYMINSCSNIKRTKYNDQIVNKIDKKYFYNPEELESSYFYYCLNQLNFKKFSNYWHHHEPAHIEYSKFLIEKIKESYYL
jgi:hypothetical protein